MNNIKLARDRAEFIADLITRHNLTPKETGFLAVEWTLRESVRQLRAAADGGLTIEQIRFTADCLSRLADDITLLAESSAGEA